MHNLAYAVMIFVQLTWLIWYKRKWYTITNTLWTITAVQSFSYSFSSSFLVPFLYMLHYYLSSTLVSLMWLCWFTKSVMALKLDCHSNLILWMCLSVCNFQVDACVLFNVRFIYWVVTDLWFRWISKCDIIYFLKYHEVFLVWNFQTTI